MTSHGAQSASRPRRKRRTYFIKKSFQARYVLYYLCIMLLSSAFLFRLVLRHARLTLRVEMSQAHSATFNTWDILRPEMVDAGMTVLLFVIGFACVATITLAWIIRRASRIISSNIAAYREGAGTEGWKEVGHPREFQHLQSSLAISLEKHQERLEETLARVEDMRNVTRDALKVGGSSFPDLSEGQAVQMRRKVHDARQCVGAAYQRRCMMIRLSEVAMALFATVFLVGQVLSSPELPPNPHEAMNDEEACLECHDVYLDEVDGHEFVVEITDVCENCHSLDGLARSHPFDVDPRYPKNPKVDVRHVPDELPLNDGMVTCGTCHDPHLSYLATVKRFSTQEPTLVLDEKYYRTYYTRRWDPVQGFDPLCASCHIGYL